MVSKEKMPWGVKGNAKVSKKKMPWGVKRKC